MPYQRKDGIFVTNFQVNGKRHRVSTGTKKRREAEKFERELRSQVESDTRVEKYHTFESALARWLDQGAPESMYHHIRILRDLIPASTPIETLHHEANRVKYEMLNRKLSPRTVNNRLACLRRMLNLAYKEWDWLDRPTASKISLCSEHNTGRDVIIDHAQLRRLLSEVRDPVARTAVTLAAFTGTRKSELLAFEPRDFTISEQQGSRVGVLTVRKSKGGKTRRIPLPTPLWSMVEVLPLPIGYERLRGQFDSARERAGMPWLQYRDLRHCYASWVGAEPGARASMLRDLLGHSDLRTTNRYLHSTSEASTVVEEMFARLALTD